MNSFILSDKYKLELHWKKILRPHSGIIYFIDAYFSGPALANADKINNNDFISIDFCEQLIFLTKKVFTGNFHWGEVIYNNSIVTLKNARFTYDPLLNNIPNLKDNDYLVIDTRNHENEKHMFNLLYPAYVINNDSILYNFRK